MSPVGQTDVVSWRRRKIPRSPRLRPKPTAGVSTSQQSEALNPSVHKCYGCLLYVRGYEKSVSPLCSPQHPSPTPPPPPRSATFPPLLADPVQFKWSSEAGSFGSPIAIMLPHVNISCHKNSWVSAFWLFETRGIGGGSGGTKGSDPLSGTVVRQYLIRSVSMGADRL